jgi:hypothetical protein
MKKGFVRNRFNNGESRSIEFRPELDQYGGSCLVLENRTVQITGGIARRNGTVPVALLGSSLNVRVLPFEFSTAVNYAVVLQEREGGVVWLSVFDWAGALEFDVATAYPASELREIQFVQSLDVMVFAHRDVHPMRLERREDLWAFVPQSFNGGPYETLSKETHVIELYGEPWNPQRVYAVGDFVIQGTGVTDVSPGIGSAADAQSFYTTAVALTTLGQRELEVSNNGIVRRFKRFKTVPYNVDTTMNADKFLPNEVWIATFTGFDGPVLVAAVSGTEVFVHTDYFELIDKTIIGGAEVVVSSNLGSYSPLTLTGSLFKTQEVNKDAAIYECIQVTTPGLNITNTAFWKEADAYSGNVYGFSREGFPAFPAAAIPTKFRVYNDSSQSFSGKFGWYSSGVTIRYFDGITATIENVDVSRVYPGTGSLKLRTEGGTWKGRLELQVSYDGGETWETIGVITSDGFRNAEIVREVTRTGAVCRLFMAEMDDVGSGTNANQCRWYLEIQGNLYHNMDLKEVLLEGGILARLELKESVILLQETARWSLGSFNPLRGYPRAVTFFEQRLWFAGTNNEASTIWSSATNDFEEWGDGFLSATTAVTFSLTSNTNNPIMWLLARRGLVAGTISGEFTISSRGSGTGISAVSPPQVVQSTGYGSNPVQALYGSNVGVFIERGGGRLRAFSYNFDTDSNESADLTLYAEHLGLESRFVEMSRVRSPQFMVLVLRADGELCVLTFEPTQNVVGWARWTFGDKCLSVAGTSNVSSDSVWLVVKRGAVVWLERLDFLSTVYADWCVQYGEKEAGDVVTFPGALPAGAVLFSNLAVLQAGVHYDLAEGGLSATIKAGFTFPGLQLGIWFQDEFHTMALDFGGSTQGGVVQVMGVDLFSTVPVAGYLSFDVGATWPEVLPFLPGSTVGYGPGGGIASPPGYLPNKRVQLPVRSVPGERCSIGIKSTMPRANTVLAIAAKLQRDE